MTAPPDYAVTLEWEDGRTADLSVAGDETVLAAAEREGLGLPFGCLTGACATCTGQVVAGDLVHRREPRALKPRHLDAEYVLLCIAVPRSDCRVRVGAAIQRELVANPWK
ncbi:2Fe-2S iron-sulfur cluster-binding protein [Halomarina litorea]|uniref:2Fe-2S iron-sulfur cluster-binding protein n=1 Tax=Halomarina litorea TaxID=2961595 RepID=UPI0020C28034|nr:2Fe-2S iron-sulfur cluster-binding protein [Halomarina sp. BCD28]